MLQKRTKYKRVSFFQEMGEKGVFEKKKIIGNTENHHGGSEQKRK